MSVRETAAVAVGAALGVVVGLLWTDDAMRLLLRLLVGD